MLNPIEALIQRQIERFQQGIEQALSELSAAVVEASVEDGAVQVRLNGLGDVLAVEIREEVSGSANRERLQRLVQECFQEAIERARQLRRDKIAQHTPLGALGVDLPNIF